MKFVVVGLGLFGRKIAMELTELGHEVLVIDQKEELIQEVYEEVTQAVTGDATNEKLLRELVSPEMDAAIVTIGTSIENSVLATLHIKDIGLDKIYAKSNREEHTTILKKIGVTKIIKPEEDAAKRLAEQIGSKKVHDHVRLQGEQVLMEIDVPDKLVGKCLLDFHPRREYEVQVIGLQKKGEDQMDLVPSPDYKFIKGDILSIVGREENLNEFLGDYLDV